MSLSLYDFGRTTVFSCQAEPRCCYALYVPSGYRSNISGIVVVLHGSHRDFIRYRDEMMTFAEREDILVVAPLFPAGLIDAEDKGNYRFVFYKGMRFDLILLAMVDEVRNKYGIQNPTFHLHGFSGGGHFAHRFYYLHPHRLESVSIGAPGWVTLLDFGVDWWVGVRNFETIFGSRIDLDGMRDVPVQMVVGADDVDDNELTLQPGHPMWRPELEGVGNNRVERLKRLQGSFESHGISVRFDLIPGAAHDGWAFLPAVQEFIVDVAGSTA